MNTANTKLLIPFLALFFIFNAISAMAAEDDSNDKHDDKEFYCYRDKHDDLICWCYQGDGTCAPMLEKCESSLNCEAEEKPGTLGKICECLIDEDKLRETGARFDKLKSKIEPQNPVYENAPSDPVVYDHRSPKIDSNSQAEIVAPNNRTGTVRVQRTRPSSSPTGNVPAPVVTDHR